jgi:hypothetical protein
VTSTAIIIYKITMDRPLANNEFKAFSINCFFLDKYRFSPPKIKIDEKQIIKYELSLVPVSPYKTTSLRGKLTYSTKAKVHQFPIKENIRAWNYKKHSFTLHLDTDCVQFMEANRTITISHWGNVNIHDDLRLRNNGAEFIGEYNPILLPKYKPESMFHGVSIHLPVNTWGFSLRDEIGNVSSTIVNLFCKIFKQVIGDKKSAGGRNHAAAKVPVIRAVEFNMVFFFWGKHIGRLNITYRLKTWSGWILILICIYWIWGWLCRMQVSRPGFII